MRLNVMGCNQSRDRMWIGIGYRNGWVVKWYSMWDDFGLGRVEICAGMWDGIGGKSRWEQDEI